MLFIPQFSAVDRISNVFRHIIFFSNSWVERKKREEEGKRKRRTRKKKRRRMRRRKKLLCKRYLGPGECCILMKWVC